MGETKKCLNEEFSLVDENENAIQRREGDKTMNKYRYARQILAASTVMLSSVTVGFHGGWPSPALVKLLSPDSEDMPLTSNQSAWVVGCFPLGAIISMFLFPILMDRFGRKGLTMVASVPQIIGCALLGFAQNYLWLYFARFILGISMGISIGCTATYIGETAENRVRGALCAAMTTASSLGVIVAYSVGPLLSRLAFAGVGTLAPIVMVLLMVWMPESPYFLVMKGKREEARKSLTWLRGTTDVSEDLKTVEQNVESDQRNDSTFKELLQSVGNRKALIVCIGVNSAEVFCGVFVIGAYVGLILEKSGTKLDTHLSSMIIAIIQFFTSIVAIVVTSFTRRRTMLLFSTVGTIVCLLGLAVYFELQSRGIDVTAIYWLPITAIVFFVFLFGIGLGPVPTTLSAELFTCNVKAKALMAIGISGSVLVTISVQLHQLVESAFGIQYSFLMFAIISVFSAIFIYFVVPETSNRSFRDIQDKLNGIEPMESP